MSATKLGDELDGMAWDVEEGARVAGGELPDAAAAATCIVSPLRTQTLASYPM